MNQREQRNVWPIDRILRVTLPVLLALLPTAPLAAENDPPMNAQSPKHLLVYVGTYTQGASEGIYHYRLDLGAGQMERWGVTPGIVNPSFLAIHPNRRFLYSVAEVEDFSGRRTGGVAAFRIDAPSGELTLLNDQPSGGGGPCHIVVDRQGSHVLVANYGGGSVAVLPISADGRLGEATAVVQHEGSSVNPRRQEGPHAHSINLDAANRFAVAADLGLDKLLVYRFDAAAGTLATHDPAFTPVAPGAGPRHFAFHPGGRFAYVINELASTVTAFRYDAAGGVLDAMQTITTLPEGFTGGNSTAEVQVHPSGSFLYGSNRGHDSIAIFQIDESSGRLTAAGHQPTGGKTPRNFGIDPTGAYLLAANQASDSIVVMRIDAATGALTPTGTSVAVPSPVCVKMMPLAP